ncbi:hypothetical protein MKEN_00226300 [Mycena kentingensis (nom. inval.)]|nr:hypothetical protein MKEN_00226300 [Mycena kentingensis (nom. inval.)]
MTVSTSPTASTPLVAVVGATGVQGGSVVRALRESPTEYRVRGFTRDASRPAAKKLAADGVEVVQVSMSVENRAAVFKAFEGADFVFITTNWLEHRDNERELAEAKLMIEAAAAASVRGIIYSSLPNTAQRTNGKYPTPPQFAAKVAAAEYGRSAAVAVPFAEVQLVPYASNFIHYFPPAKEVVRSGEGETTRWVLRLPVPADTILPGIDAEVDCGLFVRRVIEAKVFPDRERFAVWGYQTTIGEQMQQLAEVTGKNVVYEALDPEAFRAHLVGLGVPQFVAKTSGDVFLAIEEFGAFQDELDMSHEGLARKPRSWKEFVEANREAWDAVLV